MTFHVVPNNDLREHVTDSGALCPCLPRAKLDADVIVHNAYDGRETGETCRKALDLLGCALAGYGHKWTPEQRDAYEHAQLILAMHWPEKPGEQRGRFVEPW